MTPKGLLWAAVVALALSPSAGAGTVFTTAIGEGWMTATSSNGDLAANNYVAGNCGAGDCYTGEFRNFFQFQIPALSGPVLSATLLLDASYASLQQSQSITYQVTSVPGEFSFADLGAGTLYGSRTYTASDQYRTEGIALDASALAAIQAAAGGTFAVGGRVTSAGFDAALPDQLLFGRTGGPQELEIVTGTTALFRTQSLNDIASVPEPEPVILLAAGGLLLVVGSVRRRR